jgi:hypothetical protein
MDHNKTLSEGVNWLEQLGLDQHKILIKKQLNIQLP